MKLSEWVTIVLVIGFIASISLIAHYSEKGSATAINTTNRALETQMVMVSLSGAVKKPGTYPCRPGTSLNELLKKAEIAPAANRKMIPLKKVIYSSQSIEIPRKIEGKKISLEEK